MKTIEAKDRKAWRNWLKKNHAHKTEIWLAYYKKHTGKPSVTYLESVEEAVCFGWIDGIKKRIDDERYTHRFTPRRKNSKWSPINMEIAKKMIKAGLMTSAGLKAYQERKEYDKIFSQTSVMDDITTEIEDKLKQHETAWSFFQKLAPSHRRQYILWIGSAKRAATKQKRLSEAVKLLEQRKKWGMK